MKYALNANELNAAIEGRVINRNDKAYLKKELEEGEGQQKKVARRHELYLYKLLYQGIYDGDIYTENCLEYRNFYEYLVSDEVWHQRKK